MTTDPIRRKMRLVQMLHGHPGQTIAELARQLLCSERTIVCDLQNLQASGFRLRRTPQGFTLEADHSAPIVELSATHVLSLCISLAMSTFAQRGVGRRLVQEALSHMVPSWSVATQQRWMQLTQAVHATPDAPPLPSALSSTLELLAQALVQQSAVKVRWQATSQAQVSLIVPRRINADGGCWRLIGHSVDNDAKTDIPFEAVEWIWDPAEPTTGRTSDTTGDKTENEHARWKPAPHLP